MQNTKDTFYETLRTRLAALNPERTITLRGITRPALLVEENELSNITSAEATLPDCFRLRWTALSSSTDGALILIAQRCEISYETAGIALNSGMDRGRALAAMDAELLTALTQSPMNAQKQNYTGLAGGNAPTALSTNLWWSTPTFTPTKIKDDRLARTAEVLVLSYQEAGEL